MKLVKTKVKENKAEIIKVYISELEHYVMFAYLFCMLGIFPLYYKEQYSKIGTVKFDFFWNISLYFIGISLIFLLIKIIMQNICKDRSCKNEHTNKVRIEKLNVWNKLSFPDRAVFIYAVCVFVSYVCSDYKEYAFKGAAGWQMGLCSQMIFVAIYFILSGKKEWISEENTTEKNYGLFAKVILAVHLIFSACTFLLGILHRFQIDPLGMYEGLELKQKIEFLSTMGQATWFSSYVCTVFAVGVILFYISEKRWLRILMGIYSMISFGIIVTQNSDSAFMAIGGIMLLLGYYSLLGIKKWYRFCQIMSLMWGTFIGVGVLQKVFLDKVVPLDTLSVFFSQSMGTRVMFVISLVFLLFYGNCYRKEQTKGRVADTKGKADCRNTNKNNDINGTDTERIMKITKRIYQGILILVAAAVVTAIIFIYLNTKGFLLEWFGYQSTNGYLLFNHQWGSNRGSTWSICWDAFCRLPLFQKLFGVGPDCLSEYVYSIPESRDFLYNLWGEGVRLTNAHNEYLNSLLCYGIVGITAWLAVLIGGISYFYGKAKENPLILAFALCIAGYACHNVFCYQQVCCTPFLFIALGIGESLTKSENFNTIK